MMANTACTGLLRSTRNKPVQENLDITGLFVVVVLGWGLLGGKQTLSELEIILLQNQLFLYNFGKFCTICLQTKRLPLTVLIILTKKLH